jgi:SAM-dependent methyltransferase
MLNCALDKTLRSTSTGEKVLDIGGGGGQHSLAFAEQGYKVTYNDIFQPDISHPNLEMAIGDFMELPFYGYDIAFISHVLEHQLNVNAFLKKVSASVKEDGLIVIVVPPAKHQIVAGHLTLWNAGLILYNLVMAGIDCNVVSILQLGYNINVLVRNRKIKLPDDLKHDFGDLDRLSEYFPRELLWEGDSFQGELMDLNW